MRRHISSRHPRRGRRRWTTRSIGNFRSINWSIGPATAPTSSPGTPTPGSADDHRLAFKSEGENPVGTRLEKAELQFLYRRPVSTFFDVNAGIRHDLRPDPDRTYGVIGVQGLAKQFVETDANLFLSETGDLSARLEAEVDWRLTQRLILQPTAEINVAFSEDRRIHSGAGINTVEAGLRLKYEIRREFAPYVGLHYERKVGATANFARDDGEDTDSLRVVAGVSFWF